MHSLLYYVFPIDKNETHKQAMDKAHLAIEDELINHKNEEGEDSYSIADWFVIGGRWSGELTTLYLCPIKRQKLANLMFGKPSPSADDVFDFQRKLFPDLKLPLYYRDSYMPAGYEDDMMPVDEVILRELKNYENNTEQFINDSPYDVDDSMIGKCWCVVVDYHN